jgi:hypothetical protein
MLPERAMPQPVPARPAPGRSSFQPRFVEHRGRRVLRLDYSGLEPVELKEALRQAAKVIAAEPAASLRILSVLASRFDADAVRVLRHYATENRPHVRASAVVVAGFWAVVMTSVKLHERPDMYLFEGEEEALEWLVT